MKFSVMSALIGVATSVSIKNLQQNDEIAHMKNICNSQQLSELNSNLVQLEEDPAVEHEDHGIANAADNLKEGHDKHFGKTKAEIDAENR